MASLVTITICSPARVGQYFSTGSRHELGRASSTPGSTNSTAITAVMAAAVYRRMVPAATAMSPMRAMYSPPPMHGPGHVGLAEGGRGLVAADQELTDEERHPAHQLAAHQGHGAEHGGLGRQQPAPAGHGRQAGADHARAVLAGYGQHPEHGDGELADHQPRQAHGGRVPVRRSRAVMDRGLI